MDDLDPVIELSKSRRRKTNVIYSHIYVESRKTVLMNLFAGKKWRCRCKEWTCGHSERSREWEKQRKYLQYMYTTMCKTVSWREAPA